MLNNVHSPISDFSKPLTVSDLDLAFPARGADLIPPFKAIPDEFKSPQNPFVIVAQELLYTGTIGDGPFKPHLKEELDAELVRRHIQVVVGTFCVKQEHKEAGIAFLLSQWFIEKLP